MDVILNGGAVDNQMEWCDVGAASETSIMVVEDSVMSKKCENGNRGSIKNYLYNNYTQRKPNDLPWRNGTSCGWSGGRSIGKVVEVKSTMRKKTKKTLTTGRVQKNASKGAKSGTWGKKMVGKLMGDKGPGSSQPDIRGFFSKQEKLGIIDLDIGNLRKNSHGI